MVAFILACTELPIPPATEALTCRALTVTSAVAACFTPPEGVEPYPGYAPIETTWTGTVVEAGSGDVPEDCGYEIGDDLADAHWARLDNGLLFATTMGPAPILAESLTVRAAYGQFDFGPTTGWVEVSNAAGVRSFVGEAGTPEEIVAPLALTTGNALCTAEDTCGAWSEHELLVGSTPVTPGTVAEVDGLTVHAAEVFHQTDGPTGCPDWFVARAVVGMEAP